MLFNAAARDMLKQAGEEVDVFVNDWWTYLAVAAVGGTVIFDPIPRVKYLLHSTNQVEATLKLRALLRRTRLDRNVHLRSTFRRNITALERIRHRITPENQAFWNKAYQLNHPNPLMRLISFFRLPFKRQRFLDNCSLALAVWLGRI